MVVWVKVCAKNAICAYWNFTCVSVEVTMFQLHRGSEKRWELGSGTVLSDRWAGRSGSVLW